MQVKTKSVYVCTACGFEVPKWQGKCPNCGEWNTLEEQTVQKSASKTKAISQVSGRGETPVNINSIEITGEERCLTGLSELDRVLGGGIVKGSLVLLGGDPGIGKSTLLLQICEYIGQTMKILYVSGEESARQIKLRASRLGVHTSNLFLSCQTDAETVIDTITTTGPDLVVIDSIQTMNFAQVNSSPGSIAQVRECTQLFLHCAKSREIPILIIGHVNKDGAIAGPKVLEHIVDAVLYFEGDRNLSYRILRAVKNRFGSTNEIGVFEMKAEGLMQVDNPSEMLIGARPENASGTCVACMMEGSRPILAEVQGLVAKSGFGTPRRMAAGIDYNRMALLIAVLEKRAGFFFGSLDAYVNVVGGLKLDEPSSDLSIAMALVSSLKDKPVGDDLIAIGEVGLAGEIRAVSHMEKRLAEVKKLGFQRCILPYQNYKGLNKVLAEGIQLLPVKTVKEAVKFI